MRIEVDTAQLEANRSGELTGPISIQLDDGVFPHAEWRDFPVVFLGWMTVGLEAVIRGEKSVVPFMDGPFEIMMALEGSSVSMSFEQRRLSGRLLMHQTTVAPSDLVADLLRVCRLVGDGWPGTATRVDEIADRLRRISTDLGEPRPSR